MIKILKAPKAIIVTFVLAGILFGTVPGVLAHGTHTTSLAGSGYCLLRVTVSAGDAQQLTGRSVGTHPAGYRLSLTEPTIGGEHALICAYGLIGFITNVLLIFILVVAAAFIAYAAFLFVTAGANPATRTKARDFFLYAVIGLIVALLASQIPTLVRGILGV
ncbi:MAG: hypothetical protein WD712_01355 [Candidatus Spechtbacterales bacterium]